MKCRRCGESFETGEEITASRSHADCVGESFDPREMPEGRPTRTGQRTLFIGSGRAGLTGSLRRGKGTS